MIVNKKRILLVALLLGVVFGGACLFFFSKIKTEKVAKIRPDSVDQAHAEKRDSLPSSHQLIVPVVSNKKMVGSKAFVIDGNLPPPEGKARDVISALAPSAENGNAAASLSIYLKIKSCIDAQNSNLGPNILEAYKRAGIEKAVLSNTDKAIADCDGLSAKEYSGVGKWLELAASSGSLEAQLLYAIDSNSVIGGPSEMIKDPQAVERYKRKSLGYLESAAASGSVDALLSLSRVYELGIMADQNPVRAYAYYAAARKADGNAIPEDALGRLAQAMTAQQLQQAERLARAQYQSCCG